MKILFVIIFLGLNIFCFAEESQKNIKPKSKIGLEIGKQWWEPLNTVKCDDCIESGTPKGIGGSIFYHHSLLRKVFISVNIGYNTYQTQTTKGSVWEPPPPNDDRTLEYKAPNNIFATVGFGWRAYSDKIYFGMQGGLLNKRANVWNKAETVSAFYLLCVFSYPIEKYNISLETNARFGVVYNQSGINIGIAYLIP